MTASPRQILERMGTVAKEAVRRRVWIAAGAYIAISIGAAISRDCSPRWTPCGRPGEGRANLACIPV